MSGPLMATVARATAALPHAQKQQLLTECLDLIMVGPLLPSNSLNSNLISLAADACTLASARPLGSIPLEVFVSLASRLDDQTWVTRAGVRASSSGAEHGSPVGSRVAGSAAP